jgi:hypothetical protein
MIENRLLFQINYISCPIDRISWKRLTVFVTTNCTNCYHPENASRTHKNDKQHEYRFDECFGAIILPRAPSSCSPERTWFGSTQSRFLTNPEPNTSMNDAKHSLSLFAITCVTQRSISFQARMLVSFVSCRVASTGELNCIISQVVSLSRTVVSCILPVFQAMEIEAPRR